MNLKRPQISENEKKPVYGAVDIEMEYNGCRNVFEDWIT